MKTSTAVVVALLVTLSALVVPAAGQVPAPVEAGPTDRAPAAASPGSPDAADGPVDRTVRSADASPSVNQPDAPENDTIGWEEVNGYGAWYNATISVDNSDGINQEELNKLVARTMARVEEIRRLEFENTTPVEIRSREEYRENVTSTYANMSEKQALHQNVKYEATFMVGENTDTIAKLASNRGASVQGFYSPSEDRIVVISNDPNVLEMDEFTLAHELAHALQDQHFNISRYNRSTEDKNNGVSGLVEGDPSLVEELYRQRCNGDGSWNGTCVRPTSQPGGGGDLHVGMYLVSFNPYSDGPVLVEQVKQEGGWEAVNEMYDDVPDSSEQVIHPDKYPDDDPSEISINRSAEGPWRVLDLGNGSIDYATFGEAGLFAMFWYPSFEQRSNVIIRYNHLFSDARFDTYNYDHWISDGWDGDKLLPFVTDESGQTNETGYVWKLEWDSERHAEQFVRGYERMLTHRNAEPVENRVNTYRIPDDEQYGDAFYYERTGTTVVIVNAPTVEDLSMIYDGAAPRPSEVTTTTTTSTTTTTTRDTTTTATTTSATPPTTETTATTTTEGGTTGGGDDGGQTLTGFGIALALFALLAGGILAVRRYGR